MQYLIPRGGKIKIICPSQIYIDSTGGMPDVRLLDGINGTSRIDVSNVRVEPGTGNNGKQEVSFTLNEDMDPDSGTLYTIAWNNIRNPRTFSPTDLFDLFSYDSGD